MRLNESIRLVKNEDYLEEGKPYLDGIEFTIIRSRSTRSLAFISGDFDMTFSTDITVPMLKDIESQAPEAICEYRPTGVFRNVLINHTVEPFDNPKIRRALLLTLDRQAFVDILSEGVDELAGFMQSPPHGVWGMPDQVRDTLTRYGSGR